MGVLKTPSTPKSAKKTPKKLKTPAANAFLKAATPQKSAKKKGAPSLQVTTPGGTVQPLTTPKSAMKQQNLNGGTNMTPKSAKKGNSQTPKASPNTPKRVINADSPKFEKTPKSKKKSLATNTLLPTTLADQPTVSSNSQQSGKKRKSSLTNSENASGDGTKLKQFAGTKTLDSNPIKSPPKKQKLMKQPKSNASQQPKKNEKQPWTLTQRSKQRVLAKIRKLKYKLKNETNSEEKEKLQVRLEWVLQKKTNPLPPKATVVSSENKLSKRQRKRSAQKARKEGGNQAPGASENKSVKPTSIAEIVAAKKPAKKETAKGKPVIKQEPLVKIEKIEPADDEEDNSDMEEDVSNDEEATLDEEEGDFDEEEDDSDEEEDDSDYEVEKTVQAAKVTKTLAYDPDEADAEIANKKGKKKEANENGKKTKNAKKDTKPAIDPKTLKKEDVIEKGKSRYVVFVGNIPYTTDQNELRAHFASVGEIESVRIPKGKENKPRGFAYVELKNSESYEKALSLHESTLNGRRINVSYTMSGKKNSENKKSIIKSKNLKLHAMRKSGMLAGSKKDTNKRSARRAKAKAGEGAAAGSEQ